MLPSESADAATQSAESKIKRSRWIRHLPSVVHPLIETLEDGQDDQAPAATPIGIKD